MKHGFAKLMMYSLLACAALAATSDSAFANDKKSAYRMAVFIDAAEGRAVHRGKYERAIARLTEERRYHDYDPFARHTNLCVAYTKTGDFEKAEIACGQAVTLYANSEAESERDRSLALSNRGVLHALRGNVELARADFEAATELYRYVRHTKYNLARVAKEMTTQG